MRCSILHEVKGKEFKPKEKENILLTCPFFVIHTVLQRQAEKKADEQRRRRERKRKKTGPAEVSA